MNTDTPETDAFVRDHYSQPSPTDCLYLASRFELERDEWKAKFIQQNKDLGCEQMDPNGTIWDYAKTLQRERDEARDAVERLNAAALSRLASLSTALEERDEARGQRDKAIAMLWRLNVAATDCYNAAFDYSNPPREQEVLSIINEVEEFLSTQALQSLTPNSHE